MKSETSNKKLAITAKEELKILRKIVEITNSELDLDLILKEIVSIVNEMTKADSVFIYLLDDAEKNLVLRASKTPHAKELGNINLKVGEGIAGWVAKENKIVAIKENASNDPRFKTFDALPEDSYEALLSAPIVSKNRAVGVINIQHKNSHEYAKNTINLISIILKQISGVIESARLFEEAKKKALQFDSLVKVSHTITSEKYLDEILNLIVVVTAEMLNSKICSIMLLDNNGKELVIKATQSLSLDYVNKPNVKVDSSISGEVVKNKKSIVIFDVQKDSKYGFRDMAVKEGLTSMLVVPMIVKQKAIGIINIYTKKHHEFTEDEINVLQMVANQAAVAVENTKLFEETVKAKEALETRKIVEKAKGILMEMNSLSEKAAHRLIHKKSMDSCKMMKEIAESIILMEEFRK